MWRDRRIQTVGVTVGEFAQQGVQPAKRDRLNEPAVTDKLGLSLQELTPEEQREAETTGSLYVQDVSGPAAAANIRRGDIVLGVNNRRVKTIGELAAVTAGSKGPVALLIQRQGAQFYVPVRPG